MSALRPEFLSTLLETIASPACCVDAGGRYLECNKLFAERILGLSFEYIVGRTPAELAESAVCDLAVVHGGDEQALLDPGTPLIFESWIRCADHARRNYLFRKTAVVSGAEELLGVVTVMIDITEWKRTAELLQLRCDIGCVSSSNEEISDKLQRIVDHITATRPIDAAMVCLRDGRALKFPAQGGLSADFVDYVQHPSRISLINSFIGRGEPLFDIERLPGWLYDGVEREGLVSVGVIPMSAGGGSNRRPWGCFASRRDPQGNAPVGGGHRQ